MNALSSQTLFQAEISPFIFQNNIIYFLQIQIFEYIYLKGQIIVKINPDLTLNIQEKDNPTNCSFIYSCWAISQIQALKGKLTFTHYKYYKLK